MRTGILKTHSATISAITRVLDVLAVLASGVLAYYLRFGWKWGGKLPPVDYAALVLIGGLLAALLFPMFGVYHSWRARGLFAPAARAFAAWFLVFSALLALLVLAKQGTDFSRLWMAAWAGLGALFLMGVRLCVFTVLRAMRRRGYNRRDVAVVGTGPAARDLIRQVDENPWAGYRIAAVFGKRNGDWPNDPPPRPLEELPRFMESSTADEVWVAIPLEESARLREILKALRGTTANVRYVPDLFGLYLLNHGVSDVLGRPMIDLSTSPMEGPNRLLKAIEDRVLAGLILLLVSPLMVLIAIGVKLSSPGPVLFRQRRLGWDGRPFEVWKFRTMKMHEEPDGQVTQARRKDPRVTSFGAFLRRTSLDELPQFFNVLKGDMSIVGPRPHALEHNEEFKRLVDGYMLRNKVKPGITGWAQVNGWRGEIDGEEKIHKRLEHDLYYIEHWSLAFDIKIILLTLRRGFVHRNAY